MTPNAPPTPLTREEIEGAIADLGEKGMSGRINLARVLALLSDRDRLKTDFENACDVGRRHLARLEAVESDRDTWKKRTEAAEANVARLMEVLGAVEDFVVTHAEMGDEKLLGLLGEALNGETFDAEVWLEEREAKVRAEAGARIALLVEALEAHEEVDPLMTHEPDDCAFDSQGGQRDCPDCVAAALTRAALGRGT